MIARMVTWWVFFRISVEERLVYRGDFALGTLMRFLPIVTQIFLWYAIFESAAGGPAGQDRVTPEPTGANSNAVSSEDPTNASGLSAVSNQDGANGSSDAPGVIDAGSPNESADSENEEVAESPPKKFEGNSLTGRPSVEASKVEAQTIEGYSFRDMVAYYLLAMIVRAFSSMPGLTTGIARQIQTGEVKKFMIQPVDMLGCLLIQRIAHKLVYYVIAAAPFALVFYICRSFFVSGWPDAEVMVAFVLSLLMAFVLGYFIEACMGLVGFWFLEVTSLTFVYMLLNFFLSGHMFPLDLLPTEPFNFQQLVDLLPLKYLAYFPAAVFLGKIEGRELWQGMMIQVVWIVIFVTLSRIMWARGVKRYSGFGG